jgi:tol-pal system protein YbgF
MKRRFLFILLTYALAGPVLRAGTKEELVRLQSDILALQNQFRELEKTFSERTDGLKSLVVQLNDQVAEMNLAVKKMSATLETRVSGVLAADQALVQDVRSLSGKIDDIHMRLSALAQQLAELKVQSKPIDSASASAAGLSADTIYNQAFNDLVQGNADLAIRGFTAYLEGFPGGDKAAACHYYVGEAYYSQNKLPQAVAAFTRVIVDYPGSDKEASALFKRAKAELALRETQNAVADFRDVIARFPNSPESDLARTELKNLGVGTAKPAAKDARRKTR